MDSLSSTASTMSSSSKSAPSNKFKRARDEPEITTEDVSDTARPAHKKSKKAKDPLRNHLPEFEGSEDNQDLSELRKVILKKAKKRNSKYSFSFATYNMSYACNSDWISPPSERYAPIANCI